MTIVLTRHPESAAAPMSGREPQRLTVPWRTVLTLAVVLAYADGFWLTSLRGAVGAIERTQSPFASWLRESTLLLPLFVVAVLGAMSLVIRWRGPVLRGPRAVTSAALVIAGAATVVAVAEAAASAVYDYRLQNGHLQMMDSMRSLCVNSCLVQAQHATFLVHVHGVLLVSRYLLITNLVLVAWVAVMWGGRIRLFTTRPARPSHPGRPGSPRERLTTMRLCLAAALLGCAAIHAAVTDDHLSEWSLAGMFLLNLAVWEVAVAGMVLGRLGDRAVLGAAVVISAAPLVIWAWSRTLGLPIGPQPGTPETLGLPDLAASALEVAALAIALLLARGRRPSASRWPFAGHVAALGLTSVLAVTALGVAGTGPGWFDAFGIARSNTLVQQHTHGHG